MKVCFFRLLIATVFFNALAFLCTSNTHAQPQPGACGVEFGTSTQLIPFSTTTLFNIPPGQIGTKIFHFYGDSGAAPDGLKIYFDNVLIRELWIGENNGSCSATSNGDSYTNCRIGPAYWTNEFQLSGPGTISTIPAANVVSEFSGSGLATAWATTSVGAYHLKIAVPPTVCQVRIDGITHPTFAGSIWRGILHCPTIDCPQSPSTLQASYTCTSADLSFNNQCASFFNDITTWTFPNGSTIAGTTTLHVTNLGSYQASAQFIDQCTMTGNINISSFSSFQINSSSTPSTCSNGSNGTATVNSTTTGTPPYQYQWSGSNNTGPTLVGLPPGQYTVMVTDAHQCTTQQQITVGAQTSMTLNLSALATTCFGDATGAITTDVNGTYLNPLQFNWSDGNTNQNRQNLNAGNYQVTVTDARGCAYVKSATVTQPDQMIIATDVTGQLCEGADTGMITAHPIGGAPPYAMTLNGNAFAGVMGHLPKAIYEIQATDSKGCKATTWAEIGMEPVLFGIKTQYIGCEFVTTFRWVDSRGRVYQETEKDKYTYADRGKIITHPRWGCEYSAEMQFEGVVAPEDAMLLAPNAFTPNADGLNDFYQPTSNDPVHIKGFYIFNRWGEEIFGQTWFVLDENYKGWDGTFRGKDVPAGVYQYKIDRVCGVPKLGSVAVLR